MLPTSICGIGRSIAGSTAFVIGGELQQRGALQCRVPTAAKGFFEAGRQFGRGKIAVRRGNNERGAGDDAEDLRDPLAHPEEGDAARREVAVVGIAIASRGELRVALGGDDAAAHGLHRDDEVNHVPDGLLVLLQSHRIAKGERQAKGEFGLRQPAIEMMPAQPAGDRVGIGADQKHVLPRHENVVEPHLAVELVIAAR